MFRRIKSVVALASLAAACSTEVPAGECAGGRCDDAALPIFLDQWPADSSLRERFYYTSEGSQIVPYDWFLALEQAAGTELFRAPANMRRLGFLVDGPSPLNPDGLPVGFARDDDEDTGSWIGLTCAACHTGEIARNGVRVRIDGAQSLVSVDRFQIQLTESLEATLRDPAKLERFLAELGSPSGNERERLIDRLREETRYHRGRTDRNRTAHEPGFGRLDGIHPPINEAVCHLLDKPHNCRQPVAFTTPHQLWLTSRYDWVQSDGQAHDPLSRNVAQALGTYARVTSVLFDSTLRIENLFDLESWVHAMEPPRWPEQVLGPIDRAAAARGEGIYRERCEQCHALPPYPMTAPNSFGRSFVQVSNVPMEDVGTDPTFIESLASRTADVVGLPFPLPFDVDVVSAAQVRGLFVILTTRRAIGLFPDIPSDVLHGERDDLTSDHTRHYKAAPLPGIALSPPYLHNGSVRTLHELLRPAEQREKSFHVGNREYDPVDLGYVGTPGDGTMVVDTSLPGNSNAGHSGARYGTDLTEDQRMDLLEFLKTITVELGTEVE